jgi:hypothetical protein
MPKPRLVPFSEIETIYKKKLKKPVMKRVLDFGQGDEVLLYEGPTKLAKFRLDFPYIDKKERKLSDPQLEGVVVDGDLEVGLLENGEQDFGPYLIVLGDLTVKNAAIGGAPIFVTGDLTVTHCFHGYYNHGRTVVDGKTKAKLLIADDYFMELNGPLSGKLILSRGHVETKKKPPKEPRIESVLKRTFLEEDEDEEGWIGLASGKIYNALVRGKPVAK